jgi:hypothetical protein
MKLMNNTIQNTKDWLDYTDVFLDPILLIATFVLGYFMSSWQIKRKGKRELDEQFKYFTLYLSKQRDSIKKQIEAIDETIMFFDELKPFKTVLTKFIIQPVELLNTMNKSHITKSFEHKGYSPNDAVNLFIFINLCMENFNTFRESHLRFSQRQNDILNRWNELIQDFHRSKMLSINLPKDEVLKIPELMTLNYYYNEWCDMGDSNDTPENAMKVCIRPLKKYFIELAEKDHTNQYANEYIPKLEQIGITYMQSEEFIKQQKKNLVTMSGELKEQMSQSEINKYST